LLSLFLVTSHREFADSFLRNKKLWYFYWVLIKSGALKKILISILFLLACIVVMAQNLHFERITTSEGLSQNDINDIYQDKNGFLWIGTNDGLNRFDGYSFKTYRIQPSAENGLSSNLIYSISEDEQGDLWLGTSDKGLFRFDVKTETFYNINREIDYSGLSAFEQVTCLIAKKNKSVWVGTPAGLGIYKLINGKYHFTALNSPVLSEMQAKIITELEEDIYGRVWVGTQSGLYVITEKENSYQVVTINSGSYVREIQFKNNAVFIANSNGIFRLQLDLETLSNIQTYQISNLASNSMLVTQNHDVFVGTYNGVYHLKKEGSGTNDFAEATLYQQNWEVNSLSKNVITCLFEDKSGIVWIGTNGGGLNKYNPKQKKFLHYAKTREQGSLSYNKIRSIYEDSKNNIWIGTEGGGLNFLAASRNKDFSNGFQYYDVNSTSNQNTVYAIVEFSNVNKSGILLGTGYPSVVKIVAEKNGIITESNQGVLASLTNSPFCAIKDRFGNVWLGTYGQSGLYKYYVDADGNEGLLNYKSSANPGTLNSNNIRNLYEDSYGNIWIGTDKGLNLLTPEEQFSHTPYFYSFQKDETKPNSLSHNYILPIFQSSDQTIWVGTMGGGLNKMYYHVNPDSIYFEAITTRDGLPNNSIKGILEDNYGFLWISSNKGLTRYDIKDKLVVNYDESDGLQNNEFGELACARLSDGEMLFGGVNGFNAFYPKDIVTDMTPPEIALTDFHILNKTVIPGEEVNGRVVLQNVINYTNEIKLKYAENSFAIYFSSLHFSAPQKNVYKYKLEGFDEEWIRKDASDRIAKYTNLRPGTYIFKLLASNNDGIWTSSPKTLKIIITPPWYLSVVAWAAYVVIFLVSLWFFQRYSLIRIKQKNELIMEHFEKEKIQELSQMKLRFFTNISHEFRTPLTLIIGPLEKLITKGGYNKDTNDSFLIMHRNASILLRLINQLIDFRRFEQGKMKLNATESNIVPFLEGVFHSFNELASDKKIDYKFSTSRKNMTLWYDDDKLERIMYNLLSNAFKFTPEGGAIEVHVGEDDFDIVIEVIDNGIGIPKEFQSHIFERFYQAKQIKNRKVGSTGIGLSFIKGLVELHKGDISFESEEGEGTTFFVKLKKGNAHLQADEMQGQEDSLPAGRIVVPEPSISDSVAEDESTGEEKPRILIVEDNFELRKFIKDSLKAKYKIVLADNGKEGIDKARELNPDLIVSDIMMPVMSGFELCETIKSDKNISHIPIILLTARSTAENRIKGYQLGADAYISKPFQMDVLEVRIQNLIDSRNQLRDKLRTTINVEPSEVTTTRMDEKFLKKMLDTIEANISDPQFKVSQLAAECGMSQISLNKKIKGLTGQTPKVFIRSIRLKRAAQLLSTQKYSISEIAFEVGFLDIKYFRSCFTEEFGMLPSEFVKQNSDQE